MQAAIIAGADVGAVLVDITPHSLGIKCLDEAMQFGFGDYPFRFAPIIHRNTPLPASRSELFHTVGRQSTRGRDRGLPGRERRSAAQPPDRQVPRRGLAPVPAGNPIVVQLDLNLDGMLKVAAREKATGLQKQITIENALARYEAEERDAARERLNQLVGRLRRGRRKRRRRRRPTMPESCRSWSPDRVRASARRCRPGRCWRRPSDCSSAYRRTTGPRSNG